MMQVVLITGAARRIGAAIAAHCHQLGFAVVLHAQSSGAQAAALADAFNRQRPDSAKVMIADLMVPGAGAALIAQAAKWQGRLDALVNNASVFFPTPDTLDETAWDALMAVNVKAPFFLCQAAQPWLSATCGSIVNITDVYASRPLKAYSAYSISKAGLAMLTQALALEYAPRVRVNAVAPGTICWPEGEDNQLTEAKKQQLLARSWQGRQGTPDDVAKAVGFLLQVADYTTGQTLAVDGGRG